jgi:predicted transcriptional regulator
MFMLNDDESLLKWECTLFFQNNPYTIESATGIALRIGRKEEAVQQTLSKLVELDIIEKIGESNEAIYRYREAFSASQIDLS